MFIEKLVERNSKIEVKIMGEKENNVVKFYERDC